MRIIEETLRPGASVADVARRHGLAPQQLYGWRSAARAREGEPGLSFVPLALEDVPLPLASVGAAIVVQTGGLTIHISASVSAESKHQNQLVGLPEFAGARRTRCRAKCRLLDVTQPKEW